jgi:hypothetical protein
MTERDLHALTTAYIDAVGRKDFASVADMLHPDMVFKFAGPDHDKAGLLEAFERLGAILDHNEIQRIFVDGDQACVIYDFVTDTPAGPVRSIEWLAFEGTQISKVELLFEKDRWPEVLEELGRRLAPV